MVKIRVAIIAITMAVASIAVAPDVQAYLPRMGVPLTTTVVVEKPAPGQIYGNKQAVTFGVGTKMYKFILDDGYVDDPTGRTVFADVWEYVEIHQPNFVVQGLDADTFEKIQPGQTVTVRGAFAPLDRTFEVMAVEVGKPTFGGAPGTKKY